MKNEQEWSLEFDLLYQNITSNQAPGLTEYEKSVFLTRAEEAVVVMLYNGSMKRSFEETEEFTSYLNTLVCQEDCHEAHGGVPKVFSNSKVFELPEDLLFRTLEMCRISVDGCGEMDANVVPVTQDEVWRTSRDPFKKQNRSRVLRLSYGSSDKFGGELYESKYSELISDNEIVKYTVRYIKKPEPIILVDLAEEGHSVNGETAPKTCKLPEHLHQTILMEAVKAAKAVWIS